MKQISQIKDFEQYGIIPLTSEACQIGLRMMFDLTEPGAQVIVSALGLRSTESLQPNNNSGAEYSIMLSRDMLPTISVFALLNDGADEVILSNGVAYGIYPSDATGNRIANKRIIMSHAKSDDVRVFLANR